QLVGGGGGQGGAAVGRQHQGGVVADPARLGHVHGAAAEGDHHLPAHGVAGDSPDRAGQAAQGALQVVVEDLHGMAGRGLGGGRGRRGEESGAVAPGGVDHHLPGGERAVGGQGGDQRGQLVVGDGQDHQGGAPGRDDTVGHAQSLARV